MYCRKCHAKLELSNQFCPNCGKRVEKSKKPIFLIIGLVALVAVVLGVYKGYGYFNSPSYVARKYFNTVIKNNVDDIYPYIKEYEGDFVSKDLLKEKMTKLDNAKDVRIKDVVKENGNYLVKFEFKNNGVVTSSYVEVEKRGFKYHVLSGKVARNVTIKVPKGGKIKLDGKDISSYVGETVGAYDTYVIPAMVQGSYESNVELENGFILSGTINVFSNRIYTANQVQLSEEVTAVYEKDIKDTLNILYTSAKEGKDYGDIASKFKYNIENVYKSVVKSVTSTNKKVKDINFTNVDIKSSIFDEEGKLEFDVFADYEMTYIYTTTNVAKKETSYMSLVIDYEMTDNGQVLTNISTSYNTRTTDNEEKTDI